MPPPRHARPVEVKDIFAQLSRAQVRAARWRNLNSELWRESHMHSFLHWWPRERADLRQQCRRRGGTLDTSK